MHLNHLPRNPPLRITIRRRVKLIQIRLHKIFRYDRDPILPFARFFFFETNSLGVKRLFRGNPHSEALLFRYISDALFREIEHHSLLVLLEEIPADFLRPEKVGGRLLVFLESLFRS